MAEKYPGIHGEGYGTGLPNDGDYSDAELEALPVLARLQTEEKVYSHEELMAQMELDELDGATKLSPRDYGKLRSIAPQLVYYHIREGHVKMEKCLCGRNVVDVANADEYFKKGLFKEEPRD